MSTLFIKLHQINGPEVHIALSHIARLNKDQEGTYITLSGGSFAYVKEDIDDILTEIAHIEITEEDEQAEMRKTRELIARQRDIR